MCLSNWLVDKQEGQPTLNNQSTWNVYVRGARLDMSPCFFVFELGIDRYR
jgi:hypothetical protein